MPFPAGALALVVVGCVASTSRIDPNEPAAIGAAAVDSVQMTARRDSAPGVSATLTVRTGGRGQSDSMRLANSTSMGSGGFWINERVRGEAFRERSGMVEHARLIVLWRGQPNWFRARPSPPVAAGGPRPANRSRMGRFGFESTHTSGGLTLTTRYDRATGEVQVNGMAAGVLGPDSTLIIMVDRVDSIGGPPVVTAIAMPAVSGAHVAPARDRVDPVTGVVTPVESGDNVRRFLETIPAAREFIR